MQDNPHDKNQVQNESSGSVESPVPITLRIRPSVYAAYKARCKARGQFVGEEIERLMTRTLEEEVEAEHGALMRLFERLDKECRKGERIWHRSILERAFVQRGGDLISYVNVELVLGKLFADLPNVLNHWACTLCNKWVKEDDAHLLPDFIRFETFLENCQKRRQVLQRLTKQALEKLNPTS